MVLDFFRSSGHSTVEEAERKIAQMLVDGRHVYDAAMGAVFGGGKSTETKAEVKGTDREINVAQQEVRRALMVHAATHETVDLALVLAYMSVVKDAERVGDYAKNVYDLAKFGVDFSEAPDREELESYRDAVGSLMDESAQVFVDRDSPRAQELIEKADGFLDSYDQRIEAAYFSDGSASDAVARALYYRFLKRITAHIMNLMTSLVLPVDRLDYYDEAREDRSAP